MKLLPATFVVCLVLLVSFAADISHAADSGVAVNININIGETLFDSSFIQLDGGTNRIRFSSAGAITTDFAQSNFNVGLEYYILYSDGTNIGLFREGQFVTNLFTVDTAFNIDALGRGQPVTNSEFAGVLDEVRVSSVLRSSNWHWASYMSGKNRKFFELSESVGSNCIVCNCLCIVFIKPYGLLNEFNERS